MYRHDRIAELMGVPANSFEDTYPDLMDDFKMKLFNYHKIMKDYASGSGLPLGLGVNDGKVKVAFKLTAAGFPILPKPLPVNDWKTKKDWEQVYSTFMGQQYCAYV